MSVRTMLLASWVLAAAMLVGCKDPVGMPGRVHAANWFTT